MDTSRHGMSTGSNSCNTEARSKRTRPFPNDSEDFKKLRRVDENIQQTRAEPKVYCPITSLSPAVTCPAMKAMVISTDKWTTYNKTCCMKFRLQDESGEIAGIVYEPMSAEFKKNFTVQSEVIIEKPLIQPSRMGSTQYQVVINKRTIIRVIPAPVEKVTSDPVPVSLGSKPDLTAISGTTRTSIKTIIETISDRTLVDVMGIVVEVQNWYNFTTNYGRLAVRRDIRITDESNETITVSLWDEKASNFNSPVGVVIFMTQVAVRQYSGEKNLTACKQTPILIDPPTAEARRLKIWYIKSINQETSRNISEDHSHSTKTTETSVASSEISVARSETFNSSESRAIAGSTPILSDITESDELLSIKWINENVNEGCEIATIGLVVERGMLENKETDSGKIKYMRPITLKDENDSTITVNVLGDEIVNEERIPLESIVFIKKAKLRISDGVKSLICIWMCVEIDPDICEANKLRKHFGKNEKNSEMPKHTKPRRNEDTSRNVPIANTTGCNIEAILSAAASGPDVAEFVSLSTIERYMDVGDAVGFVGRVVEVEEWKLKKNLNRSEQYVREITLTDGFAKIGVNIHSQALDNPPITSDSVLLLKKATVIVFSNKKKLNCLIAHVTVDPDIRRAERLKKLPPMHKFGNIVWNQFPTFCEINNNIPVRSIIDIIGIVVDCEYVRLRYNRQGKTAKLVADIQLRHYDEYDRLNVAIYGTSIKIGAYPINSVVVIKNAKVVFRKCKKALVCLQTNITVNPDIPEARRLKKFVRPADCRNNKKGGKTDDKKFSVASNRLDLAKFYDLPGIPDMANFSEASNKLQKWWSEYPVVSKYFPPINVIRERFVVGKKFDIIGLAVKVGDVKVRMINNFCRAITEIVLRDIDGDEMTLVMCGVSPVGDTLRRNSVLVVKNATVIFHEGNKQISCESHLVAVNAKTWQTHELRQKFEAIIGAPAVKVDKKSRKSKSVCVTDDNFEDGSSDQELLDMLLADESMKIADEPMEIADEPMEIADEQIEMFGQILPLNVDYTPINVILDTVPNGSIINILGIIEAVGYSSCDNQENDRCDDFKNVKIVDNAGNFISMRIHGRRAEMIRGRDVIIAGIDVKVHVKKNSKSLICLEGTSSIYVEPRIDKATELQKCDGNYTTQNVVDKSLIITPNNRIFEKHRSGQTANVLGILTKKFDCRRISGTPLGVSDFMNRRIVLLDDSNVAIDVIIFNQAARDFIVAEGSILLIEKVMIDISDNNKVCYCFPSTNFLVDPTEPEYREDVNRLKYWSFDKKCQEFRQLLDNTIAPIPVGDVVNSTMIQNNPAEIPQSDEDETFYEEQSVDDEAYMSPDLFDDMVE